MPGIDDNTTNFIGRQEYEARHAELQAQIVRMTTNIDTLSGKIDTLGQTMNTKIDTVIMNNLREKVSAWKYVLITIVSIFTGGLAYAVGDFLVNHHL